MTLRLSGGRRLLSPPGNLARPTAARVRQAVMNILAARLPGCHWLDLCCGSGVVGCEALQHGAARLVAVERDVRIAAVARSNLDAVAAGRDPKPAVQVVRQEVLRWLEPGCQARGQAPGFDLIYADPPYRAGLYEVLAEAVCRGGWLRPGGLLLLESGSDCLPELPAGWRSVDQRRYGGTLVLILKAASPEQTVQGV
ncbi:MAG: 16S rRNA (guanine(966)-N(2))-methyltransferase RsmD [Synechococcaceae cyanobacterium]|nr:16S rRNA (guanine(966)-N(2))-methyltransferase RsmD [Synechococcaceae cyanobacterium]